MSLGPETPIELMIRRILEEKLKIEQRKVMEKIKVIKLAKGQKLHNLDKTFNLIVKGSLRNNDRGQKHGQFEILADYPLQINLQMKDVDDPFAEEEIKKRDRLNFEALEPTVMLSIGPTHITKNLDDKIEAMLTTLSERIKIPNSPNQLRVGSQVNEWHILTNNKFEMQINKVYCQMGGRGILKGEIVNAGCISQSTEVNTILAIETLSFLAIQVSTENQVNSLD